MTRSLPKDVVNLHVELRAPHKLSRLPACSPQYSKHYCMRLHQLQNPSGEARRGEGYSRDGNNKEGRLTRRTGADLNLKGFWGVVEVLWVGGRTRSCFMG